MRLNKKNGCVVNTAACFNFFNSGIPQNKINTHLR